MPKPITQEYIKSILHYDPDTGIFRWAVNKGSKAQVGYIAGSKDSRGSMQIRINGTKMSSHRLAWLYMKGEWPEKQIDHINCNPADNRWANLREATQSQNQGNRGANKNNKLGTKGVYFKKTHNKYAASIRTNGKLKFLGHYDSPEQAHGVYCEEAKKVFVEFARGK